jgi:RNA polymerase sigma factor (sigma-70 family)
MGPPDDVLLAGMAAGDQDLSAAFVRRFQARVYGVAVTMVGTSGLAEDIAQETFVRAWRHARAYDPHRGRVATWLLAIARHASVDVLRGRRDLPLAPEDLFEALGGSGRDGEADRVAEAIWMRDALSDLPPTQATAVFLSVCYGMTAAEIAELEHIPLGTAKTRIRSGLRRLRQQAQPAAV